ncbi:TonB-dependent receptor [Filimonas lacunae]|nr:TonB-dependent receptor [Filimonas lacunae]
MAQNLTITGKVTDEKGNPLSGVSVTGKNSVTTAQDGSFTISITKNEKNLTFSYVGFATQVKKIEGSSLQVSLATEEKSLSEVVVVGYGTQKRKELTGAVFKLADSSLNNIPLSGPDQALRGRVPGVTVSQSSGTPGASINVQIRGAGSISSSSQPLYVIDGVIMNTGSYAQVDVGGQTTNALSEINPADIESFEVLKDAAAAAVYGARGANGVILITTKRGANQQTKVGLNASYGTQSVIKRMPTLTGPEYVALVQEAVKNVYGSTALPSSRSLSGLDNDPSTYPTTNWQDLIFKNAPIQNYELNMRGGNDKTKFFVSAGYFDQQATIIGSEYKRYNTRINLDNQVTSRLKISGGLSLSRSINNRINNDNNIYGVLSSAVLLAPYFNAYKADGTYAYDPNNGTVENPLAAGYLRYNVAKTNRVLANFSGEYKILNSLTFKSQVSADYIDYNEAAFAPSTTLEGASGPNGVGKEGYSKELNLMNENILTYRPVISANHHLTLTGVASYQESRAESMYGSASNYPGDGIRRLSAASTIKSLTSAGTSYGVIGYLARANYDYLGKYLFSASVRRDGSSRVGSLSRWGTFPAVSGAWRVSEEDFLKGNSVISDLKIRGSWGKLGNSELGNFASRSLVSPGANATFSGAATPGLYPYQLGNDSLRWESSIQTDLGVEVGLFKNRIQLVVDLYNKTTNNLISNKSLVGSSGFTSVSTNIGKVQNKGLEIGITSTNITNRDITWTTSLNISFNKNKILKLASAAYSSGLGSWVQEGEALGSFRGYRVAGIFQSTAEVASSPTQNASTTAGDIKFKDLTHDGKILSDDQEILGSANPKYFGGMTNTLTYKGFELSVFFQFVEGNKVLNYTKLYGEGMNSIYGQFASTLDRWTPTHTNTNVPRAAYGDPSLNRRLSDRFVEDGSYARLKNIILSYNLPKQWLNKLKISNVKVFAQAQNLVTWTKYSGFDPEVSYSGASSATSTNTAPGTDFLTYPQSRAFTFGANISF